jgi:neutral amino acid transport system permease protein
MVAVGGAAAALLLIGLASPAHADGESVTGTLRVIQTNEFVPDVTIKVTAQDGTEVGQATSNANGQWSVDLPGPGTYKVELDKSSLPDGIELASGIRNPQEVRILPGRFRGVIFQLSNGASEDTGPSQLDRIMQLSVDGLRLGLIIAIAAVGLSLIFGTTGLTNFAHGELVTIGAFIALWFNVTVGLPLVLAAVMAIIGGLAIGALNDLGIWRPLRKRRSGLIAQLVVSIGVGLALRYLLLLFVGGDTQSYHVAAQTAIDIGNISVTPRDLIAMTICLVVLVGVALMLQLTRIGKAMRAVADNRDLAASSGINVERVILVVWMLGGALAGLGGVILGWTVNLRYDMGFNLLLLMFAGVTLGGLGTAYGALLGSVVIGIFIQISSMVLPGDLKNAGALLVLILVLLVRPSGILGARQRIG